MPLVNLIQKFRHVGGSSATYVRPFDLYRRSIKPLMPCGKSRLKLPANIRCVRRNNVQRLNFTATRLPTCGPAFRIAATCAQKDQNAPAAQRSCRGETTE